MQPIASVIIPTFNYARYIAEAIESVLSQTYPQQLIEIIVVDDGSTDDTKIVLNYYIASGLIKYYYQENNGKASATRFAIEKSKGKYIFNLDADDYFLPDKIEQSIKVFESDEAIVHVASPARMLDEERQTYESERIPLEIIERPIQGKLLLKHFYTSNILFGGGSTYAARASVLKAINIHNDVDMYIDEFLILAILPFGKSFFVREELSVWRVHRNNYSVGVNSTEQLKAKGQRLLKSSDAILTYLEQNDFDPEIVRLYRVQHLTRSISFKENTGSKQMNDIFKYAYNIFIVLRPGWKIINKYNVLNRLLPMKIFSFLKNFRNSVKQA